MDKTTQLFIRACKSNNSITRINQVYKRCYGDYDPLQCKQAIASIILSIVDENTPMTLTEYHRRISEYKSYSLISGEEITELDLIIYVCRDKIRHTEGSEVIRQGLVLPTYWRNK